MKQDEIIEMAEKAGIIHPIHVLAHLEDFAKLVAAKERDALVLLLRNLADDHTPSECADMICALQSLGAIRARGEA
jgi:hypothetical protein